MISDSASGRSNGVRFTSAMLAISRITNARSPGGEKRNQPNSSCLSKIVTRLRLPAQSTTGTVESTCGTSYETSCATARIAPSSEYLFRLDQPGQEDPQRARCSRPRPGRPSPRGGSPAPGRRRTGSPPAPGTPRRAPAPARAGGPTGRPTAGTMFSLVISLMRVGDRLEQAERARRGSGRSGPGTGRRPSARPRPCRPRSPGRSRRSPTASQSSHSQPGVRVELDLLLLGPDDRQGPVGRDVHRWHLPLASRSRRRPPIRLRLRPSAGRPWPRRRPARRTGSTRKTTISTRANVPRPA